MAGWYAVLVQNLETGSAVLDPQVYPVMSLPTIAMAPMLHPWPMLSNLNPNSPRSFEPAFASRC